MSTKRLTKRRSAFANRDPNGNGSVAIFDDASNVLATQAGEVDGSGTITAVLAASYARFDEVNRQYQSVLDIDPATDESTAVDPATGSGVGNSNYLTAFDAGSRVAQSFDALGNPSAAVYDAANRTLSRIDAQNNRVDLAYDANSNVVQSISVEQPGPGAPAGLAEEQYLVTADFDQLNRRTGSHIRGLNSAIDHAAFFSYDSRGNLRIGRDAEGKAVVNDFDDLNRLLSSRRFSADPSAIPGAVEVQRVEFTYDKNSRKVLDTAFADLANLAASRQDTRYFYDDANRIVRTIYPDTIGGTDRVDIFYDANNNVIRTIDQRRARIRNFSTMAIASNGIR